MLTAIQRGLWYALSGGLFVFVILVTLGQAIESHAEMQRSIVLRDELSHGVHRISGIVPVAYSCAELSVRAEQLTGPMYRLTFETWKDPALECHEEETPRWVRTVVFTEHEPAQFVATMDGEQFPIVVQPYAARHSSSSPTKTRKP